MAWVHREWSCKGFVPLWLRKKQVLTLFHSGKGKTMETIKRPVVARSLQGDSTQRIEVFMSNENTSNDIIMNRCHYTFVQSDRNVQHYHLH